MSGLLFALLVLAHVNAAQANHGLNLGPAIGNSGVGCVAGQCFGEVPGHVSPGAATADRRVPASQVTGRAPAPRQASSQAMPQMPQLQPPPFPGSKCIFDPKTRFTACTLVGAYTPGPAPGECIGPVIFYWLYNPQGKLAQAEVGDPGYGPCPK